MQRVAERGGAIGIADDRLAQIEPRLAQLSHRPLGALERRRPAGCQVDPHPAVLGRQRGDQQRVGGGTLPGLPPQGADQLRVLCRASGDYERLVLLLVLHLGLLSGAFYGAPSPERPSTLLRGADRGLKRG